MTLFGLGMVVPLILGPNLTEGFLDARLVWHRFNPATLCAGLW
jgi:hypothetical protein